MMTTDHRSLLSRIMVIVVIKIKLIAKCRQETHCTTHSYANGPSLCISRRFVNLDALKCKRRSGWPGRRSLGERPMTTHHRSLLWWIIMIVVIKIKIILKRR